MELKALLGQDSAANVAQDLSRKSTVETNSSPDLGEKAKLKLVVG